MSSVSVSFINCYNPTVIKVYGPVIGFMNFDSSADGTELLDCVYFSDETWFYLDGYVNT